MKYGNYFAEAKRDGKMVGFITTNNIQHIVKWLEEKLNDGLIVELQPIKVGKLQPKKKTENKR